MDLLLEMRLSVIFFLAFCAYAILAKPMDVSNRDDANNRSGEMEAQDRLGGEVANATERMADKEE